MRGDRRWWWIIYALCAGGVVAALVVISVVMFRVEERERLARAEADVQKDVRLALWRMDSWLAPLLAREAARPYFEYLGYYPSQRAYSRLLNPLDPQEVLTRSPLVTFESDYFVLHFQYAADGTLTSPQVPSGNFRDQAEYAGLPADRIGSNGMVLSNVEGQIPIQTLETLLACGELQLERDVNEIVPPQTGNPEMQGEGAQQQEQVYLQNVAEKQRRVQGLYQAKQAGKKWVGASNAGPGPVEPDAVEIGPLVPFWMDFEDGEPMLGYVRRVQVNGEQLIQGFLADWGKLRANLLQQSAELFPAAELVPASQEECAADETGLILATVPARLSVSSSPGEAAPWSAGRSALALTWAAVMLSLVAGGLTLKKSIAYGEQRSRFASTVTHELRTPLTTFRMYSEMLAEGMVSDEATRTEYLRTLQGESGRLAALVENVLAYARLEDGRATARKADVRFGDLVSRATAPVARRVQESGFELDVTVVGDEDRTVVADVEAVGQIVFNLVDNACKYAAAAERKDMALTAELTTSEIRIRVRDHGPGVPAALRRPIFQPFERGELGADGSISGVGLGLALSRGLARDLGGDLVLETVAGPGASFLLTLPVV